MSTDSSFKIKIPAKASAEHSTKTPPVPRKAAKRRITSDDDSSNNSLTPPPSISTKSPLKRPRLSQEDDQDEGSNPRRHTPKLTAVKSQDGSAVVSNKRLVKKKAKIVSGDGDEGFVPEQEEKLFVASKIKLKDTKGKAKGGLSGSGGNAKIIAKNESRSAFGTTSKKRPREEDDEVDVTTVPAPAPPIAAAPTAGHVSEEPPPKKKKLPTIKKKPKAESSAASTVVGSPAPNPPSTSKPAGKPIAGTLKPSVPPTANLPKKPQAPVQATTMNPSGSGDFDLRDSNTWRSLIGKGSSISGPRVGIEKRVSTEERRKQLDKMRDEARAAREQRNRETFDLQAQSRKIAAFEKKLQNDHLVRMNGPHILGAAFIVRPVPQTRPR